MPAPVEVVRSLSTATGSKHLTFRLQRSPEYLIPEKITQATKISSRLLGLNYSFPEITLRTIVFSGLFHLIISRLVGLLTLNVKLS